MLNPSELTIKFENVVITDGILEIIPTKIIIEIPFPIPLLVICSPNHISIEVPAINPATTTHAVSTPSFINTP